jgi:hypothetical protein
MAWFQLAKRLTDEEFMERMRRSIMLFDRIRPWLIAMYVLVLAGIVTLMPAVIKLCVGFGANNNAAWIWIGLEAGLVIGISLGWMFGHCIHTLITLIGYGRTERHSSYIPRWPTRSLATALSTAPRR